MYEEQILDPRPVHRVEADPAVSAPRADRWPVSIPAVAAILERGMDLSAATILLGENGSGKSTLVEAIAMAFGLGGEGGSSGVMHSTAVTESPLHEWIRLRRGAGSSRWGYFLRAETLHGLFTYLNDHGELYDYHRRSHGEAFWDMISTSRFSGEGFFVLDEPEAGLSFQAQLRLLGVLSDISSRRRAQILLATHSPILASLPGAQIYELSESGIEPRTWEELELVEHYRRYLDSPERYLRHLLG